MAFTQAQVNAARELTIIIGQTIRELKEVPSGHLYARLMDKISLEMYQGILKILINARLIEVSNHSIKWIGN